MLSDVQVLEITGGRKLFGHHLAQPGAWAQAVSGRRCDSDGLRVTWVISASVTLPPSSLSHNPAFSAASKWSKVNTLWFIPSCKCISTSHGANKPWQRNVPSGLIMAEHVRNRLHFLEIESYLCTERDVHKGNGLPLSSPVLRGPEVHSDNLLFRWEDFDKTNKKLEQCRNIQGQIMYKLNRPHNECIA